MVEQRGAGQPEPKTGIDIESSNVSPAQMDEIEAGDHVSVKKVATDLGYTTAWISLKCKLGQIKAVKPTGGQWRIPRSEYERLRTQGFPIIPQQRPKPHVTEVEVSPEQERVIAPELQPREQPQEDKESNILTDLLGLIYKKE